MSESTSRLKTLLIVNPTAGSGQRRKATARTLPTIREIFPDLRETRTEGPGHAEQLAREAAQKNYGLVITAGGDGTIHQVANALVGTATALAILPSGTANILAREIGLPLSLPKAGAALRQGALRPIHPGKAGDRYFLMVAGIGLDAQAVKKVETDLKGPKHFAGMTTYFLTGLSTLFTYRYPPITFRIQEREFQAVTGVVARSRHYGGPFVIAPSAGLEKPGFEILLFKNAGPFSFFGSAASTLLRNYTGLWGVETAQAKEMEASSPGEVLVQADGELIGRLPMRFSVAQETLNLLIPSPAG